MRADKSLLWLMFMNQQPEAPLLCHGQLNATQGVVTGYVHLTYMHKSQATAILSLITTLFICCRQSASKGLQQIVSH